VPVAYLRKKFGGTMIIRTGGDFLWEQYVERTKKKILFSEFYSGHHVFTKKEETVLKLTRWVLTQADHIVFNSDYQRRVWALPYALSPSKTSVIENAFAPRFGAAHAPVQKDFVCIVRAGNVWKNTDTLVRAFARARVKAPDIRLDLRFDVSHDVVEDTLSRCYCAILVSLGDISPNFVFEALSFGKPVILTKETGLTDRLGTTVLPVDPRDEEAIADAIVEMTNPTVYATFQERIRAFSFVHTYADIAKEFITVAQHL
jgi:glycosyltransferase involved in cell wall biosynthesis